MEILDDDEVLKNQGVCLKQRKEWASIKDFLNEFDRCGGKRKNLLLDWNMCQNSGCVNPSASAIVVCTVGGLQTFHLCPLHFALETSMKCNACGRKFIDFLRQNLNEVPHIFINQVSHLIMCDECMDKHVKLQITKLKLWGTHRGLFLDILCSPSSSSSSSSLDSSLSDLYCSEELPPMEEPPPIEMPPPKKRSKLRKNIVSDQ